MIRLVRFRKNIVFFIVLTLGQQVCAEGNLLSSEEISQIEQYILEHDFHDSSGKGLLSFCFSNGAQESDLTVETSLSLYPDEKEYIKSRNVVVKKDLEAFFERDFSHAKHLPKIAFCFSGGGYRSMISSLGFVLGANKIGLPASYFASLSGSTWLVINMFLRKQQNNIGLDEFHGLLRDKVVKESLFDLFDLHFNELLAKLVKVFKERLAIESADFFGALLADLLFGDLSFSQDYSFADIRSFLKSDYSLPFPLFALNITDLYPYEWLEVQPFMSGSDVLQAYIPTKAFDSEFDNGICSGLYQERTLSWFLGAFGSAYNISFADVLIYLSKKKGAPEWFTLLVEKIIKTCDLYEDRVFSSPVNNFSYNMQGRPLRNRKQIDVSDAGMDFNLPLPILLKKERNIDIIFVYDSSLQVVEDKYIELRYAEEYAKRKGLKFPSLDNPEVVSKAITVFEDKDDPKAPIIVFLKASSQVSALKFTYSEDEFDSLYYGAYDSIIGYKDVIQNVIERKIVA